MNKYRINFNWILNDANETRLQVYVYSFEDNFIDHIDLYSAYDYDDAMWWLEKYKYINKSNETQH